LDVPGYYNGDELEWGIRLFTNILLLFMKGGNFAMSRILTMWTLIIVFAFFNCKDVIC
jgi:hypothetical protein